MQISCYRCGGDGKLPQYSWNKGGICFTCGGDGKVNTFSTIKLNKMTMKSEIRNYVEHSSNRDIASIFANGEHLKLKDDQHIEMRRELRRRAEEYYGLNPNDYLDHSDLGKAVLKELDKREKEMPESYKKSAYFTAGKVALVPVHWLKKFQGNPLRRDKKEMKEFADQLLKEGLKDPVMLIIGQQDRRVSIGEGNHRTFAFEKAGLDYVPVRVARQQRNEGGYTYYYDKMSQVPVNDYFKSDASPEEVFDTFYDHGEFPKEPPPSKLKDAHKVLDSLLGTPHHDVPDDVFGININNIDLKELGIKTLYSKNHHSSDSDLDISETIKAALGHFFRVYGNEDYIDYFEKQGALESVDDETRKVGSYLMDFNEVRKILDSLRWLDDGERIKKKKSAADEYDELMELLGFDD